MSTLDPSLKYVPGRLIIKFEEKIARSLSASNLRPSSVADLDKLFLTIPILEERPLYRFRDRVNAADFSVADQYYLIRVPDDTDIDQLAATVMQVPGVELAVPDYIATVAITPNDPLFSSQWAFNDSANAKMNFPEAWDLTRGSSNIVIAVLDTGLDTSHSDVNSKNTGTGYNYVANNSNIQDDFGHGTLVAGIAAASTFNQAGVAGACWGCLVMPVKVCDANGSCPSSTVQNGIYWAVDHGAKIINMSLGGATTGFGAILWQDAINYAYNHGVVAVASAGNANEDLDVAYSDYPAQADHVIVVGATNANDQRCDSSYGTCMWPQPQNPGSGHGSKLDVMAPGSSNLVSTNLRQGSKICTGDYCSNMGGTSAAAPFVAGLAGLVLSIKPDLSPDQVESFIKQNAVHLGTGYPNNWYGYGRIDAYQTIRAVVDIYHPQLTVQLDNRLKNRSVTLELRRLPGFAQQLPPIPYFTGTTDTNGSITFDLPGVATGTYNVFIKPRRFLRAQVGNIQLVPGSQIVNMGWIYPGDIDGNNKVDVSDAELLRQCFGMTDPVCLERADFGSDGYVGTADTNLFNQTFGRVGDGGEMTPSSYAALAPSTSAAQGQLVLDLAQPNAHMRANTIGVGQILTLALKFNTAGVFMAGAGAVMSYDSCVLEPLWGEKTDLHVFSMTQWLTETGTLEFDGIKWDGAPVAGAGVLANIPFKVNASVPSSTTIALRFRPSSTFASQMVEDGTVQPFLGSVTNFVLYPSGTPQRPTRTAHVINPLSGKAINESSILLEAQVSDPCNSTYQVVFYVFYDGQWHQVGADTDGTDGWSVYWDASQISDQIIKVKAFAGDMAGNGVETLVNDDIVLDRQPPTVSSLVFAPTNAMSGQPVMITVSLADNLSQARKTDVYVVPSTNGATSWEPWNLLGIINGTSGSFVWNTTGYVPGPHAFVLFLEDNAGNQTFWPGATPITYQLRGYNLYLPLILR